MSGGVTSSRILSSVLLKDEFCSILTVCVQVVQACLLQQLQLNALQVCPLPQNQDDKTAGRH